MKYKDLNNMLGNVIKVLEDPNCSKDNIEGVVSMLKGINIGIDAEGVTPNYILETMTFRNNDDFVKFQQENIIFIHKVDLVPSEVGKINGGKIECINIVFHREIRKEK